jgi:hypothetical protein
MRSSLGRSRWSRLRATACVLAVLLLGEAYDTRGAARGEVDARTIEIDALDSAHARLAALMAAPATAQSMRDGVRGVRRALAPAISTLREEVRAPTAEIEHRIAIALAQLDDGGAALAADRSEFVLSALVPIASALDETRTELAQDAP